MENRKSAANQSRKHLATLKQLGTNVLVITYSIVFQGLFQVNFPKTKQYLDNWILSIVAEMFGEVSVVSIKTI